MSDHVLEHPSPSSVLPSSQTSSPALIPSPHLGLQTGVVPFSSSLYNPEIQGTERFLDNAVFLGQKISLFSMVFGEPPSLAHFR